MTPSTLWHRQDAEAYQAPVSSSGASPDAGGGPPGGAPTSGSARGGGGGGVVALVDDPSRPTATQMSRILREAFELHALRITDESAQHEGDAGALEMGLTGESHFRVELAAPEFEGLSPVQRQQRVFDALGELMPRIHALSLVTRTPAEVS
uniref:BolA family transcriptional regulator n=1 Tax=Alexandrium monilatum TaxID=311494 RepID=A0A7S4T569_9DINO